MQYLENEQQTDLVTDPLFGGQLNLDPVKPEGSLTTPTTDLSSLNIFNFPATGTINKPVQAAVAQPAVQPQPQKLSILQQTLQVSELRCYMMVFYNLQLYASST